MSERVGIPDESREGGGWGMARLFQVEHNLLVPASVDLAELCVSQCLSKLGYTSLPTVCNNQCSGETVVPYVPSITRSVLTRNVLSGLASRT